MICENETKTWNENYEKTISVLQSGKNVIILGCAGVGKSYLINKIAEYFGVKTVILTASTGCASVNISGETIYHLLALSTEINKSYDGKLFETETIYCNR